MTSQQQMRALIAEQAVEWFVLHRSGELTPSQQERFIDWLRASPAHTREYLALTGFTEDLRLLAQGFSTPAETLVARARADREPVRTLFPEWKLAADDPATAQRSGPRSRFLRWTAAAGIAVVALLVGLFGFWRVHNDADFSTAHAEQRSWRMPDGSTVHLNSGSRIKVRFGEHRREVELIRGQALFQVSKDAQRPFWVRAGDTAVRAVGTEFDVYRQPQRTLISVVEGRVAVWRLAKQPHPPEAQVSDPIAELDAGQQARVERASATVSRKAEDVRKTVAWLQRQVVFDHDPLAAAVEEFNRYSDLRIRVQSESLRSAEVSGIFSAYDAEAFIRFLERQPEMRVQRSGREVAVTAANSPAD